mmetsp:Transcript_125936/g.188013  ORF Transcript_125936/g.188013 Transcript_125936/m.188013 type:complete len:220 (-) Transcript_125936:95-754(-)
MSHRSLEVTSLRPPAWYQRACSRACAWSSRLPEVAEIAAHTLHPVSPHFKALAKRASAMCVCVCHEVPARNGLVVAAVGVYSSERSTFFTGLAGLASGAGGISLGLAASASPALISFSTSLSDSFIASEKVAASFFKLPATLPRSFPKPARFFGPKINAPIAPITASSPQPSPNSPIDTPVMPRLSAMRAGASASVGEPMNWLARAEHICGEPRSCMHG